MRIKLLMLALAASLTAGTSARAALSLEYFLGNQNFTPAVIGSPTPTNPTTLTGLKTWTTAGSPLTSLNFPGGVGTQIIVKIVLKDTFTGYGTGTPTAAYPTGSGYTIPDDGSEGLFQYAMKLTFNPSIVSVAHDPINNDGQAPSYTVNGGGSFGAPAGGSGLTNENAGYANSVFGANFVTLGNIMFGGAFNSQGLDDGTGSFTVGTAPIFRFSLANFVLTATGPGANSVALSLPSTTPPSFSSFNGQQNWDTQVWGAGLNTVYSLPVTVPVPEPSSMVLAGLVVSGIGYRLRRRKVAEVAA